MRLSNDFLSSSTLTLVAFFVMSVELSSLAVFVSTAFPSSFFAFLSLAMISLILSMLLFIFRFLSGSASEELTFWITVLVDAPDELRLSELLLAAAFLALAGAPFPLPPSSSSRPAQLSTTVLTSLIFLWSSWLLRTSRKSLFSSPTVLISSLLASSSASSE